MAWPGGEGGACGKNLVKRVDGSKVALAETGQVDVTSGDAFTIETPGDGGFGKD